jgi:hypothetical protein
MREKASLVIEKDQDHGRYVIRAISSGKRQTFEFEGNLVQIFSSRAGDEGKASFQLKLPDIIIYVVCADKEALKAFIAAADRLNKDPDFDLPEEQDEYEDEEMEENIRDAHKASIRV